MRTTRLLGVLVAMLVASGCGLMRTGDLGRAEALSKIKIGWPPTPVHVTLPTAIEVRYGTVPGPDREVRNVKSLDRLVSSGVMVKKATTSERVVSILGTFDRPTYFYAISEAFKDQAVDASLHSVRVIVGHWSASAVSGIKKLTENSAMADVEIAFAGTDLGNSISKVLSSGEMSALAEERMPRPVMWPGTGATERREVRFEKYDDGWRAVELEAGREGSLLWPAAQLEQERQKRERGHAEREQQRLREEQALMAKQKETEQRRPNEQDMQSQSTSSASSDSSVLRLDGPGQLRLSNCDDGCEAFLDGSWIAATGFGEDSGWVDLAESGGGRKQLKLNVLNKLGAITYGFEIRVGSRIVFQQKCGTAGVQGCNGNRAVPAGIARTFRVILERDR